MCLIYLRTSKTKLYACTGLEWACKQLGEELTIGAIIRKWKKHQSTISIPWSRAYARSPNVE